MKAAIYCRLSKEDGDGEKESESIQNQKSMLVKYAVEQGCDIYGIYCDEDYSGADRDRPAFCKMLQDASERKFDSILVKTQARFTRDMELVEKYLHGKFPEWGIRFIAVVDHVDTCDAANKKSRQINGLINEWYLEDLSNNVRAVLDHKRREGKYIATFALYGYQKHAQDNNRLVIDPEAAQVVRRIFALYLAGNGTTKIARMLNEAKIPSPTRYKRENGLRCGCAVRCPHSDLWGKATVYRMLTTQTYAGDLEQGRHKKVSYKSKKTVWVPRDKWIVVPGTHEPIVERAVFDKVQQMLSMRARGGENGTVNPFAGLVFCGLCGACMEQTGGSAKTAGQQGSRRYFRCRTAQRDKTRCAGQSYLPAQPLQALVLEQIRAQVKAYFEPVAPDSAQAWLPSEDGGAKRAALHRLKTEAQRRRNAVQALYLDKSDGVVSSAQFAQLNEAYLREITQCEARIAQLERETGEVLPRAAQRKALERRLQELQTVQSLSRELVCLLIEKIVVYPVVQDDTQSGMRRIEIHWKF